MYLSSCKKSLASMALNNYLTPFEPRFVTSKVVLIQPAWLDCCEH